MIAQSILHKVLGVGFLVLFCFSLLGCQTAKRHWPAIEGQVLDGATDNPIEDVIVLANWQGVVSYSNTRCFHQVRMHTDSEGRFMIPAWDNAGTTATSAYQGVSIYVHKYGYRESKGHQKAQPNGNTVYYMEHDQSSPQERLAYLAHFIGVVGCGSGEGMKDRMLPLYRAIYREASSLATTQDDEKFVRSIRAVISLGWRDRSERPPATPDEFDAYFNKHVKKELLQ